MIAVTYFMPNTDAVRALLYALLAVAALVVIFPLMVAVMPSVVGCCAMAAPVVGQLLVAAVIIAAFAMVTKPK
jgi:hypothetical protein